MTGTISDFYHQALVTFSKAELHDLLVNTELT